VQANDEDTSHRKQKEKRKKTILEFLKRIIRNFV
jgi:hypothetical protein